MIEPAAFYNIPSLNYLGLQLVANGSYGKIIENSTIRNINIYISDKNPINSDHCFAVAPILCPARYLGINGPYCADIMDQLRNCPDASRLQIVYEINPFCPVPEECYSYRKVFNVRPQ